MFFLKAHSRHQLGNHSDDIDKPKLPKQIPIGTFRCKACGYLESFAMPEFDAK